MRPVLAALFLLTACGGAAPDPAPRAMAEPRAASAEPAVPAPAAPPAAAAPCDPHAPESPCPIVGRWRIVKVYNPAATSDPTGDDMAMVGATLTATANGDASGAIRWDGPDNGQFDISDICTGPFLSPAATARPDASRDTLSRALAAWGVKGDARAARHLGCDSGHWALPSDASGQYYGLVLPMGRTMAFEWFDDRMILAERID